MERTAKPVVYVDTHIVCWLYQGMTENKTCMRTIALQSEAFPEREKD
ncbi:hypothetical protein U27_04283 [Candidatus Vecturithrix granuli]|uniref:Uncharacterized protein n=1 Tax=Vecturithrix granuli TaxID=1499967 RepID=A0A081BYB3_VECG1|nr:hypothetical protein U27_04283 [Candidatus Vecturithrix granuli]